MSILNDDRKYSDDPEEYLAWCEEVKREFAGYDGDPEDYENDEEDPEE